jgi:diguanylate cyclase (GGDEF)-like protein
VLVDDPRGALPAKPLVYGEIESRLNHCKLSIGVSLFHKHDKPENLFKQADLALYQAKDAGRNIVRIHTPKIRQG